MSGACLFTYMKTKHGKSTAGESESVLKEIVKKLFKIQKVGIEDSIETIGMWDSMGHMELMAAIERTFNIRIKPEDIINLTSIKALKKYLKERL